MKKRFWKKGLPIDYVAETPARLTVVTLPTTAEFHRVLDLLEADKTIEALTEAERLAQASRKVAETFEGWESQRADPKLAAKQFALWQEDLRARLREATRTTPSTQLPPRSKHNSNSSNELL